MDPAARDSQPSGAAGLARQIAAETARVLRTFRDDDPVVAVILHGSLVSGDFVPGHSDVDLLMIVDHELERDEVAGLIDAVQRSIARSNHNIDFRVVTGAAAGAPTRAPAMELYVGHHAGEPDEIEQGITSEPDLVVELSVARAQGQSLIGPSARSVIGPVQDDWVILYGDQVLERWERLADDQANAELMVLTACRIWRFAVAGEHSSKTTAGRWALEQDPSLAAVSGALRRRLGDGDAHIAEDEIRRVLAAARQAVLRRPSGGGGGP